MTAGVVGKGTPRIVATVITESAMPGARMMSVQGSMGAAVKSLLPTASSTMGPMRLDVRLLRGYDGPPPEEVTAAAALGVGGADALRDARDDIEALLPFENYGIVGVWQGSVTPGEGLDAELADNYRLVAGSAETSSEPTEVLRLNAVELVGADQDLVAADLWLAAGRLYILGVLAPGAETPDLILLIRAERAAQER